MAELQVTKHKFGYIRNVLWNINQLIIIIIYI